MGGSVGHRVVWEPRKHESVSPLLEIETRFVGSLAHCVVTFVAGLSGLTEEMECKKTETKVAVRRGRRRRRKEEECKQC